MMSPPRMSRSSMVGLLGVVGSISVRRTDSPGVAACQRGLKLALAMRRSLDDARPSRLPQRYHRRRQDLHPRDQVGGVALELADPAARCRHARIARRHLVLPCPRHGPAADAVRMERRGLARLQVCGVGASDLVYLQGYCSNVDMNWESPYLSRFLRCLAAHARLIVTDRRGWGGAPSASPPGT